MSSNSRMYPEVVTWHLKEEGLKEAFLEENQKRSFISKEIISSQAQNSRHSRFRKNTHLEQKVSLEACANLKEEAANTDHTHNEEVNNLISFINYQNRS